MRIIVTTYTSLDGVMQAPGGPDEDPDGGFRFGGWQFPFDDEELGEWVPRQMEAVSGFLLGRRTYEIFASHWPKMPEDEISNPLNTKPKHVVSTTLQPADLTWGPTTVHRGVDDLRALEDEGDGDLLVWGSSVLVHALAAEDLVDEYHLWTYPLLLGAGKRLFDGAAAPRTFELLESRSTSAGSVFTRHRRAGEVHTGSFPTPDDTSVSTST
jgi:dihydrofolate reductase